MAAIRPRRIALPANQGIETFGGHQDHSGEARTGRIALPANQGIETLPQAQRFGVLLGVVALPSPPIRGLRPVVMLRVVVELHVLVASPSPPIRGLRPLRGRLSLNQPLRSRIALPANQGIETRRVTRSGAIVARYVALPSPPIRGLRLEGLPVGQGPSRTRVALPSPPIRGLRRRSSRGWRRAASARVALPSPPIRGLRRPRRSAASRQPRSRRIALPANQGIETSHSHRHSHSHRQSQSHCPPRQSGD